MCLFVSVYVCVCLIVCRWLCLFSLLVCIFFIICWFLWVSMNSCLGQCVFCHYVHKNICVNLSDWLLLFFWVIVFLFFSFLYMSFFMLISIHLKVFIIKFSIIAKCMLLCFWIWVLTFFLLIIYLNMCFPFLVIMTLVSINKYFFLILIPKFDCFYFRLIFVFVINVCFFNEFKIFVRLFGLVSLSLFVWEIVGFVFIELECICVCILIYEFILKWQCYWDFM